MLTAILSVTTETAHCHGQQCNRTNTTRPKYCNENEQNITLFTKAVE